MSTTVTVFPPADLYARLDGLRVCIAEVLADETRDRQLALEWAEADLERICLEAPAWCGGCQGRGAGLCCAVCGAPVPARLRRRQAGGERGEVLPDPGRTGQGAES